MSVFINSKVHLPSSCEKCPFNYADMSAGVCTAADKTIDTRTYGRKRHPDRPMVELPTPHGRLIDADKLMQWIEHVYGDKDIIKFITDDIKRQPTIIEAEVSEQWQRYKLKLKRLTRIAQSVHTLTLKQYQDHIWAAHIIKSLYVRG